MTPTRWLHACLALVLVGVELGVVALTPAASAARPRPPALASYGREAAPARLLPEDAAVLADRLQALPPTPAASRQAPAPAAFLWPADGRVSGPFGERRGRGRHPGMDIEGHVGDPVRAATAGRVVSAGPAPSGYAGYGNLVLVDVGGGLLALYAHLSAWTVVAGQQIFPGDRIGSEGCTGSCTGPHLHFELRLGGVAVDPAAYLPSR